MSCSLALLLAFGVSSHESRTLAPTPKPEGVNLTVHERFVVGKTFILVTHSVNEDGLVNFAKVTYRIDGTPIQSVQEGNWGGRMNRFATNYTAKGAVQSINEETNRTEMPDRTFRNPTKLWFWKTHPKVGESILVTILFQNTIAPDKIRFTYEGDETMQLAGRKVTVHRVREEPQSSTPGVYTLWWHDDQGMGVKRYHTVGKKEYADEIVYWY